MKNSNRSKLTIAALLISIISGGFLLYSHIYARETSGTLVNSYNRFLVPKEVTVQNSNRFNLSPTTTQILQNTSTTQQNSVDQIQAVVAGDLCDSGCVPLIDMKSPATYFGEDGGLYGNYSNNPPSSHQQKILDAKDQITPLDENGTPSESGKIVLLTMGMSNTSGKSNAFIEQASANTQISDSVVIVNGARGSITAEKWANGENWEYVADKLVKNNVTAEQVQAAWMLHANFAPQDEGKPECTSCMQTTGKYVDDLSEDMHQIIEQAHNLYPNLQVIYISNRTYGGYGTDLNDEPYAYESGIAVRRVILDQINGTNAKVAYTNASVLAWGPYMWADGTHPNSEGLAWLLSDYSADGIHPSEQGYSKAGAKILNFFLTSPYASSWFTGGDNQPPVPPAPTPTPPPNPSPSPTPPNPPSHDGDPGNTHNKPPIGSHRKERNGRSGIQILFDKLGDILR